MSTRLALEVGLLLRANLTIKNLLISPSLLVKMDIGLPLQEQISMKSFNFLQDNLVLMESLLLLALSLRRRIRKLMIILSFIISWLKSKKLILMRAS